MKKAVLVTFSLTTRVVIDVNTSDDEDFSEEEYSEGVEKAMQNIASNPMGYLCEENVTDFVEDTELPYERYCL